MKNRTQTVGHMLISKHDLVIKNLTGKEFISAVRDYEKNASNGKNIKSKFISLEKMRRNDDTNAK